MTESKKSIVEEWQDPDEIPDLSAPEWVAKFEEADLYYGDVLVQRGRPKLPDPKVSTTIRLDADILENFAPKALNGKRASTMLCVNG